MNAALKGDEGLVRALQLLDHTLCAETHKFGVLYVDYSQTREEQILANTTGSPRYNKVCDP